MTGHQGEIRATPKRKPWRVDVSRREWLTRLLPLAGATVLLAVAALCAWQAWVIAREDHAREQVQAAQRQAAQKLAHALRDERTRIDKALRDRTLLTGLARGDVAGRETAASRVRDLLPEMREARFFSPDLDEVLDADYQTFGYARAAQLMQAQTGDDEPQVGLMRQDDRHRLTLAQAVGAGADADVLAYAWLAWPLESLLKAWHSVDPGAGRLTLQLGAGGQGLVLATHGSGGVVDDDRVGRQVAGSDLWVNAAMPQAPIMLPRHWMLAALFALLALMGAAILLRVRFRSGHASSEEETLLSESTSAPAKKSPTVPAPAASRVDVDPGIFRAYDIRGVVGKQLSAEVAHLLGRAIGSDMRDKGLTEIVVGRDGRLSGPELLGALADGLRATGIDVIDIGAVPTPLVYFAAYHFNCGSGVAVTGSHNPPDYNGFKIVIGGDTLSGAAITALYQRIHDGQLVDGETGNYRQARVVDDYIERIASDVQAERPLKVVADAGNGIAGAIAPQLLEAIGCEVVPLYCEVDGHFPNHHPDPSDPHNLVDLERAIVEHDADIGVAFDGDGDRLGVVTRAGEVIFPDRLLVLFARDVLSRDPGATIIYDVKCTGHLGPEVLRAGGSPLMWRTGHSLIKAKMRETGAALAGEMSGHFFFRERWYGFDDGLYSAARLLEILAGDPEERSPEAIIDTLPKGVSTPELKIDMVDEGANHDFIDRFRKQADFGDARLTTIDGVRADWPDGWGLVRASNTTPVLVLRFDADSEEALERIKQHFREQLLTLEPGLTLPF